MAEFKLPSGESTSEDDYLDPINVLSEELNNSETVLRLNAIKKLSTIALALGVEKTKSRLIPFLTEKISTEEGEILMVLAEELGNFTNYVGGPAFAYTLLPLLKELAKDEEVLVREKAVESLRKIAALLTAEDLENYFVNLIISMTKDDCFTSHWSVCGLFSVVYSRVSPMARFDLWECYSLLCVDDIYMVKRAVAGKLEEFAKSIDLDSLKNHLIHSLAVLTADISDSVRVLTIEGFISIASRLMYEDVNELMMPLLRPLFSDNSWKVRFQIADLFIKLQIAVGPEITRVDLVPIFLQLLNDTQIDVKKAAASRVCDFCRNLYSSVAFGASPSDSKARKILNEIDFIVMTSILPIVKELVMDANEQVRMALSSVIMRFSPILGKQRTLENLIPLFLTLLNDECIEVRLNIIINLDCVNEVIGIEKFSETLLPAVLEHTNDPKWRVCLAIIEYMPLLACQLGAQLFTERHLSLCVSWLTHHVYNIRKAGIFNLKKLVELFGTDWAEESIIPKIIPIANDPKYLHRMSFLFCVNELTDVCSPNIIAERILPIVLLMGSDRVANVRFNVAKTLKKIGLTQPAEVKSQIKPLLDKLSTDNDTDVKYFATESISSIPWN